MNFNIIILPQAQAEIELSYLYYKNKVSTQIAKKYINEIELAYKVLNKNPFFNVIKKNYRALPLKKFPFLIIFEVFEDIKTVKILSVFNTNQDTKKYPE